jgi:hypothetical protein
MTIPLIGAVPPLRSCALTWRQLYETDCFFQRELEEMGAFARRLRKRGFTTSQIDRETFEQWDRAGATCPIAFARGQYLSGLGASDHSNPLDFRHEQAAFESWDSHAWDAGGYPTVSALFSPWHVLVVPDVVKAGGRTVPLEVLLRDSGRDGWAESFRWLFQEQHRQWSHLHEWWDPTLRVLVRLQNRYLPFIRGNVNLRHDDQGVLHDPEERRPFEATAVLDELGITASDIADGYRHLARRGYGFEFGDGQYLLRQLAPRAARRGYEGSARRAQDFYDAAEVLRRFYRDLTGELLPDAGVAAPAHDERELRLYGSRREQLLGHGPTLTYDGEDAKRVLGDIGIYPHGIHVIVEGDGEERVVRGVVRALLGKQAELDVVVTNLRGIGAAPRLDQLLGAVTDYALRTVVIVDNEGDALASIERLIQDELLEREDVLVQQTTLEESNFSDEELVSIATCLAATANPPRPAAALKLTASALRAYHDGRVQRSAGQKPGLADSLLTLARREENGAVQLSKLELAEALLAHMLSEVADKPPDEVIAIARRRPVMGHVVERVAKPLARTGFDGPRSRRLA